MIFFLSSPSGVDGRGESTEDREPCSSGQGGVVPLQDFGNIKAASPIPPFLLSCRFKHWAQKRWKGVVTILSHKAWNYNNIGYVPIEFVLMIVSFWGPNVALSLFPGYSTDDIDLYVGATSLVAGQRMGRGSFGRCTLKGPCGQGTQIHGHREGNLEDGSRGKVLVVVSSS